MHAKPGLRAFLEWKIARSGSVITDVIQTKVHDFKPTTRYFFAATLVIAISLAIYMQPLHAPGPVAPSLAIQGQVASEIETPGLAESISLLFRSLPIRLIAFIAGISTTMHMLATTLALQGPLRWLFGIGLPTLGVACWQLGGFERPYFSLSDVLLFAIPLFTIGFAAVNFLFGVVFSTGIEQEAIGS